MIERPRSKCPFCGAKTLCSEVRGEMVRDHHKRLGWLDHFVFRCEYCGREWETPVVVKGEDDKKEDAPMQVSYNGFTGELVKLEQTHYGDARYSLTIYDGEKSVKHSFERVKLEDMKFLGGVVNFG